MNTKRFVLRVLAVFCTNSLSVIGAGIIVGVTPIKAMLLAGLTGVVTVAERLLRAYVKDGIIHQDELDAAFSQIDARSKTVEDLLVDMRREEGSN